LNNKIKRYYIFFYFLGMLGLYGTFRILHNCLGTDSLLYGNENLFYRMIWLLSGLFYPILSKIIYLESDKCLFGLILILGINIVSMDIIFIDQIMMYLPWIFWTNIFLVIFVAISYLFGFIASKFIRKDILK
jgi:hypothetical protein